MRYLFFGFFDWHLWKVRGRNIVKVNEIRTAYRNKFFFRKHDEIYPGRQILIASSIHNISVHYVYFLPSVQWHAIWVFYVVSRKQYHIHNTPYPQSKCTAKQYSISTRKPSTRLTVCSSTHCTRKTTTSSKYSKLYTLTHTLLYLKTTYSISLRLPSI